MFHVKHGTQTDTWKPNPLAQTPRQDNRPRAQSPRARSHEPRNIYPTVHRTTARERNRKAHGRPAAHHSNRTTTDFRDTAGNCRVLEFEAALRNKWQTGSAFPSATCTLAACKEYNRKLQATWNQAGRNSPHPNPPRNDQSPTPPRKAQPDSDTQRRTAAASKDPARRMPQLTFRKKRTIQDEVNHQPIAGPLPRPSRSPCK